jgi:hypothetical protein
VCETGQLPRRGDIDTVFFLLLRTEPSIAQRHSHARPHQTSRLFEPGLTFQKSLGVVIEGEARRLTVTFDTKALRSEVPGRDPGIFAAHAEIDRGSGKAR